MADIKAHLLPFSVDKEGTINTKQYFKYEKNEADEQYETIMMGRKLVGRSVALNDKTQCLVYEKMSSDRYQDEEDEEMEETDDEEAQEKMPSWTRTDKSIQEFILWKKDTAPNAQDPRISALDKWIDISKAIHEPIPLPTDV
ncbi:uncharacterized protein ATC70_005630 [Mucor velutinosus]|uniref:Uncharacterized protein n=1 Tax=Mucor velutinosus TaxID=708070 RepID=A0AAN7DF75_9FUNG|nr:hypothetical protein ATC70_005630 [Mucor velutinosus]